MNARERILSAVNKETVDRIPCDCWYTPEILDTLKRHFGGRMIIDKLSEKDRKLLDNFYRNVLKKEFTSWDRTKPDIAEKFGIEVVATSTKGLTL